MVLFAEVVTIRESTTASRQSCSHLGCVEALLPVRSKTRREELGLVAAVYDVGPAANRCQWAMVDAMYSLLVANRQFSEPRWRIGRGLG